MNNKFIFKEFGLLDILFVVNYFQNRKQGKQLKRANKIALVVAMLQEQDQEEIIQLLKEIRDNGRKN